MATTPDDSLPIVDLQRAKDPGQRLAVARQLVQALETVGFLFIDNMDGFDSDRLLDMTHWFFNLSKKERLPLARKLWNPESANYYRGYFPLQDDDSSYKEGFEIGQPDSGDGNNCSAEGVHPLFLEPNMWPSGIPGAETFQQDMVKYYWAVLESSLEILRLVSLGSGLQENWFESMFCPDSMSTLRLLHYAPRPEVPDVAWEGDTAVSCGKHSDTGFVTLLATFNYGGLEILKDDGNWMAVPCRPHSLVMNIGDMLSSMSGGRFKATIHRVVDPRLDRFSVPFFLEPRFNADVTRVMPASGARQQTVAKSRLSEMKPGCKRYGHFLMEKMKRFVEYKPLLDIMATTSPPRA